MFKKIVLFFTVILLALPVFADDSSIIPVLWLFCRNGKIQSLDWCNAFKNTSCIYQYNGQSTVGTPVKAFEFLGGNVYQYNGKSTVGTPVKAFEFLGGNVYQYNGKSTIGTPVKAFEFLGGNVYQYNGKSTVGTPVKAFEL